MGKLANAAVAKTNVKPNDGAKTNCYKVPADRTRALLNNNNSKSILNGFCVIVHKWLTAFLASRESFQRQGESHKLITRLEQNYCFTQSNSVGNDPRGWFTVALDHNSVNGLHVF